MGSDPQEPADDRGAGAGSAAAEPVSQAQLARRKRALRADLVRRRRERGAGPEAAARRRELGLRWAEHLEALLRRRLPAGALIAAYLPTDTEPPLMPALTAAHAAGHRVIAPVSLPQRRLDWVRWDPETPVRTSAFGVAEPVGPRLGPEAFAAADVRLIPALAVDGRGLRLGWGGGFYDAALAAARPRGPEALEIGVVFHDELLPAGAVPAGPHDAAVALVCTERGLLRRTDRGWVPAD